MGYNGLQLPVVGVWNTQLSIPTKGCLKIQNFILPRPRQLLVGAVMRSPFFFSCHLFVSSKHSNEVCTNLIKNSTFVII